MILFVSVAVIIGQGFCLLTSNKVYTLFSDKVTWNEALTICSELGMSMVTPLTKDSHDALLDFTNGMWKKVIGARQHYWTSFHSVDGDTNGLFNDRCDYLPVTAENLTQFGTWSGSRCWKAEDTKDWKLKNEQCSKYLYAICERVEGECIFNSLFDTSVQTTVRVQFSHTEDLLQCRDQCLRSVASDNTSSECWGVSFNDVTENCTMYFTNARHQLTSAETPVSGIDLHVKTCHEGRLNVSKLNLVAANETIQLYCHATGAYSATTAYTTYPTRQQPTTASQVNVDPTPLKTTTSETSTPSPSSETARTSVSTQKTAVGAQLSHSTTKEPSTSTRNTAPTTKDTMATSEKQEQPTVKPLSDPDSSDENDGENPATVKSTSAQTTGATTQATGATTDDIKTSSDGRHSTASKTSSINRDIVSETTPYEDLCPCPCFSKITPEAKEIFLESLLSQLYLNVTNISSTKRRYVSAPDDRVSATSIGVFGGVLLSVPFVTILLLDLATIKSHVIG